MKIYDFNISKDSDYIQASAMVQFEECGQDEKLIFIKTKKKYADDFWANPHAFLVGCLLPAMHFKEKRIAVDEKICPFLEESLYTAMHILKEWTKGQYQPLKIQAQKQTVVKPVQSNRAAMFMSGGMDSLAGLRLNRLNYPKSHPGYVKDCFFLHGFDIGGVKKRGMKYHVFERAKKAIYKITKEAETELIPVYTNIRHLCDERSLWLDSFFGAVLASISHTFSKRVNMVFISSSFDIPNLHPCGSHPLLDPEYSSFDMRIRHRDYLFSRIDKIKIVSQWNTAFQNFRVCLANSADKLNCGRCEKCVRTMTELTALGLLHRTKAFAEDEITAEHISQFDITIRTRPPFYRPLVPLLKKQARDDLAFAIENQIGKS